VREVTEVDLHLPHGRIAKLEGDARDTSIIGTIRTAGGEYDPGLVAALEAIVQEDWVCLDIGANVGPISLTLGELCPRGEVHAFEPVPITYEYLRRNFAARGATNLHAHHLALLDRRDEVVIHYNPDFSGGAFISGHLEHGETSTVEAMTLDEWAASNGLTRLDLIKLDVEGSELTVLSGAAETLRRFRPALIVELNPITMRRMAHQDPRDLYRQLCSIYGKSGHFAFVPASGPMIRVASWKHVERVLAYEGLTNLYCSPRRLVPGRTPGLAGKRETTHELVTGLRTYSRLRLPGWSIRPDWAALHDPRASIRLDQLPEPRHRGGVLHGGPGERIDLPLLVVNRGRMPIIGEARRFGVTTRVIWIDPAGGHTVDDRSRVTVPTMRPGAGAALTMPLFLPDDPGRFGVRVTLFQEDMSWFHDLDEASSLDLEVQVEVQVEVRVETQVEGRLEGCVESPEQAQSGNSEDGIVLASEPGPVVE
jgi:FkbM family methyltransferase